MCVHPQYKPNKIFSCNICIFGDSLRCVSNRKLRIIQFWSNLNYWFFEKFVIQIVSFHSLAVALLRYSFIVHDKSVVGFGKEKLKTLFWYLSIGVPFLTILWVASDLQDVVPSKHINKCNGNDHRLFLLRSWSSFGLIATNFRI